MEVLQDNGVVEFQQFDRDPVSASDFIQTLLAHEDGILKRQMTYTLQPLLIFSASLQHHCYTLDLEELILHHT